MTWKKQNWLAIDTETTGVDTGTALIVELGAVAFSNGRVIRKMVSRVNPGTPIPEMATAVHGITDDDVLSAPSIEDISSRFLQHVSKADVLVGYNWPFDSSILQRQLGQPWDAAVAGKPVIDPLVVVRLDSVGRWWKGQGRHRLTNVATRLGIGFPVEKAHSATLDATLTCLILWMLKEHLPDDTWDADELIRVSREQQEVEYKKWKASHETADNQPHR